MFGLIFIYATGAMVAFILTLPRGTEPPVKWWKLAGAMLLWPLRLIWLLVMALTETFTRDVDWRL